LSDVFANAPHSALAWGYAEDVVAGKQIAGHLTRLACQRFLADFEREDAPWYFDCAEAERACDFIESLPHIKGEWAKRRELLVLEAWQCFIVCNAIGWRHHTELFDEDGNTTVHAGTRRFRTVYVEVARKNAKSTLAAAIGLYMLEEDGEAGAEVYSAATTRNQAKIVFNTARQMAKKTPSLPLEVRVHNISYAEQASLFEALHAQGETLDGYNIHCALNDELHAWKNRDVYNVIETATGARQQPLIFNITTAGSDTSGICYELRTYLVRVLEGQIEDDSFFGVIYTLDKDDDWTDREVWIKANPNYNVSVYPLDMENMCRKAQEVTSQQNAFLTKRLNVWVNAAEAWMDMRKWEACRDTSMRLEDFLGENCYDGIDLASKIDINSKAKLFEREIDGKQHVFCFMRHRAGFIQTTPGNVIDVDQIEQDTLEEVNIFKLVELSVDPMHNSTQYGVHMAQQGIETIDVRPTVANFSEAMKWLEAYVIDGTFHHNCPVLTWMVSNVEVKRDQKDNIYPRKGNVARKIDGVIALLMALNRLRAQESQYFPGEGVVII
jgi:phage terminase large subunit-like protein